MLFVSPLSLAPSANGAPEQNTGSNQRPETPLMVWRGVSEVGFLRVELWSRPMPGNPLNQDLVVKSVSPIYSITFSGVMALMPYDVKTEPDISQIYIRVADDGATSDVKIPFIVATLSKDGTLHLYSCGGRSLQPPCTLRPAE